MSKKVKFIQKHEGSKKIIRRNLRRGSCRSQAEKPNNLPFLITTGNNNPTNHLIMDFNHYVTVIADLANEYIIHWMCPAYFFRFTLHCYSLSPYIPCIRASHFQFFILNFPTNLSTIIFKVPFQRLSLIKNVLIIHNSYVLIVHIWLNKIYFGDYVNVCQ